MGVGSLLQLEEAKSELTRLGVVVALPAEARCLVNARVKPGERAEIGRGGWLQLSGIGAQRATHAAHALLDAGATVLLSWGTAGGLDPALVAGSLVLPRTVIAYDGTKYPVDADWHARMCRCLAGHVVSDDRCLIESDTVLTTPEQKTALNYRSGAVAVDMESVAVAGVAKTAGVPFLAIRAILDPVNSVIPDVATGMLDAGGRIRWLAFVHAVLTRPTVLKDFAQLRSDLRAAQSTLSKVAELAGPNLQAR